ncbi:type IVB secretion system protein IcmH/DotU [Vibrio proteolyticus]
MNHLDEETLVWDTKQQSVVDLNNEAAGPEMVRIKTSTSQLEFLRHFDKAENQLINISAELLTIALKVSTMPEPDDIHVLREELVSQINELKAKGAELTYPVAVIDKLCFLYAVVLDEFIIYTEWGEQRSWENKTLLSELFGMRNGGELFFTVTEKAMRQPHKLIDLLEVIYLFLNIGFRGQYREAGSDQLKRVIHQLEQLISQYRQSGALYCHTKTNLPKCRKPTRRKRYLVTTMFFVCLIATSVGFTYFWYDKTLPHRARDFQNLPDYSQRYVLSGEVNDIVFISSDSDLAQPPAKASKVELVNTTPPLSIATSHSDWLVQLATFSTEKNATRFISTLSPNSYEPVVDKYKAYFRVIIRTTSSQQAQTIQAWFKDKDNINAIIVQGLGETARKQGSQ